MSTSVVEFDGTLRAVRRAALDLPTDVAIAKSLGDDGLLGAQRSLAEARRAIDACAALIAGEIGHRSRRDLGHTGLAQREGFRTPEALVQHHTGSSSRDATTLVTVGSMVHEAHKTPRDDVPSSPWLGAIGRGVADGSLTVEAARAIATGLGQPSPDGVTPAQLEAAATELLLLAGELNVDELLKRARYLRDVLDEEGIADRARSIYEARSVRRVRRADGLPRYIIDPDIESAAFLDDLCDRITSPRRGGPRFVDETERERAEAVVNDPRSTDQYLHDAVVQLLHIAVDTDDAVADRIVGSRTPAVRVLVTAEALAAHTGHGYIEGVDVPVPVETVERAACTGGTVLIEFAGGQPLNLGREQRLFSRHQRIAMAARDGGCMWPECDRRPSWCEAHHIDEWQRDDGRTDVADGILLCRFHHLLLHENHWRITRDRRGFWLVPPPDVDGGQAPRPLRSKSPVLWQLERSTRAG